jgi:hypothetical protein
MARMGLGSLVCGLLISIIYLMDFLYLQSPPRFPTRDRQ